MDGDGCDGNCKPTGCGNGVITSGEQCDDGNLVNGDGCDSNCKPTGCGNGVVWQGEQCDDGNLVNGDGCDGNCKPTGCGNGVVTSGEQCDDGNLLNDDVCSSSCQVSGVAEVEPNGTTAEADANAVQISSSAVVFGAIGVAGDNDIFRVNVTTASVVRFETFDSLGVDCIGINPDLRILNSAGTAISTDAAIHAGGIGNCAAQVAYLLPGTYYARVTAAVGTIAGYRLQVAFQADAGAEAEPNQEPAAANNNVSGGNNVFVLGGHQVSTDIDFYAVTVPAGASIRAEVIEGGAETCESNGVDSRLTLFDAAGTQLVDDDDDGRGYCSAIDGTGATPLDPGAKALAAGTYYLVARASSLSQSGAAGQFDYRLVVTVRSP